MSLKRSLTAFTIFLLTINSLFAQEKNSVIQKTILEKYNFQVKIPDNWRSLTKSEKDSLNYDSIKEDFEYMEVFLPKDSLPNSTVENISILIAPIGTGMSKEKLTEYCDNDLYLEKYKKIGLDEFVELMKDSNRKCSIDKRAILMNYHINGAGFITMLYLSDDRLYGIKLIYTEKLSDETLNMFTNIIDTAAIKI